MLKGKKALAAALAAMMVFGASSVAMGSVSEAAHHRNPPAEHHYADGTTNPYSHALKQEDERHEQTVRNLRYEYRKDGNKAKYERALKKEQERHDRAVKKIKADSEAHIRHHHE